MTATHWGRLARQHWELHLPTRLAALDDPDAYFEALEDEATAYYAAIRDGMLDGVNPNNGTISWAEFLQRIAWANQTAHEIVNTELIYIPGEDTDTDDDADHDLDIEPDDSDGGLDEWGW